MRGYLGPDQQEPPRPSDVTFREKAANRRAALAVTALTALNIAPVLRAEFDKGKPAYVRRLTVEQAGRLVASDAAYHCQECAFGGHPENLHITVGKYRDDIEKVIGSGNDMDVPKGE